MDLLYALAMTSVIMATQTEVQNVNSTLKANESQRIVMSVFEEAKNYTLDPAMILAVMETESNFEPGAHGDSGRSFGIMQVLLNSWKKRMPKELWNDRSLEGQIKMGTFVLSLYRDIGAFNNAPRGWLMYYNVGEGKAKINQRWMNSVKTKRNKWRKIIQGALDNPPIPPKEPEYPTPQTSPIYLSNLG